MFSDPNFEFLESWEHHGNPTRWLRAYQDTLRATAAAAGWDHVAEALEAKGWSHFWKSERRLTGVTLSRQMALIAFRARKAGAPRRGQKDLRTTVAEAVKDALNELAAAGVLPTRGNSAAPPPVASPAAPKAPQRRAFFPERPASRVLLTDADAPDSAPSTPAVNLKKDQNHHE